MRLTDTSIRNAKPRDKPYKIFDERGLFLLVTIRESKWWRFRYRWQGKEKLLSLGTYPDISLSTARDRRDNARRQVAMGVDPSAARQDARLARDQIMANTFEAVAREWLGKARTNWVPSHGDRIMRRLERDVFPWLGKTPVSEVSASGLLQVIRRIENRGAVATAHRALQNCSQIMRFAVATQRAPRDSTTDLRGALPSTVVTHRAAITTPQLLGPLLRALDSYEGTLIVKSALKLAPIVFVRPGELRHARWAGIDFQSAQWRFRSTKCDVDTVVPLCTQALAILQELQPLTGGGEYVFPSARSGKRPNVR